MSFFDAYATLRVFSSDLSPEDIAGALGTKPTDEYRRDPDSRYRPVRENNFWSWCTEGKLDSVDPLEHVRFLLKNFAGQDGPLADLRKQGCEMDVVCFLVTSGQGGPYLDLPALRGLEALGTEIWWDVYFGEEDEYNTEA